MPEASDPATLAVRWVGRATSDLEAAHLLIAEGTVDAWVICFHAQQAIEKHFKAVIASTGAEPPFTHNLVSLRSLLPGDLASEQTAAHLGLLTTYAAATRYVLAEVPEQDDPTMGDARRAVAAADTVADSVTHWLRGHGFDIPGKPEVDRGA